MSWRRRMVRGWQAAALATVLCAGVTGAGHAPATTGPSAGTTAPAGTTVPAGTAPVVGTTGPGDRYVALGDSYAAGVGAGEYLPDSGVCLRSTRGYPQALADVRPDLLLDNRACGGATTVDVLADQVTALDTDTRLVTLTVGGNDIGFSQVMGACATGDTESCLDAVRGGESSVSSRLPGLLTDLFTAVRAGAPRADVYVLGYPHIFETGPTCSDIPVSPQGREAVNQGVDLLDSVLAEAADDHDFVFVDVRAAFHGHGVCATQPWMIGLTDPSYESFHPSAAGQSQGYRDALLRVLGDVPEPATSVR